MTSDKLKVANRYMHHKVMSTVGDMALQTIALSFEAKVVATFPGVPAYRMHIYRALKKYATP